MKVLYALACGLLALVLLLSFLPIFLWSPFGGFEGFYVRPGKDDSLWQHLTGDQQFECGRLLDDQVVDIRLREDGLSVNPAQVETVSRDDRTWVLKEEQGWSGPITLRLEQGRLHIDGEGHHEIAEKVHNPLVLWYLQYRLWTHDG